MNSPLVSVIVPTVDRQDKLLRAIRSIKSQTYDHIEIVIIEEGVSQPQVPSLLDNEFADTGNIIHIFNTDLSGLAGARNQAVAHSSGEYLAFLDDDDEWYPSKLEKQVAKLQESDAEVCYTGVERIGPNGEVRAIKLPDVEGDAGSRTLRGSIIGPSVFMISRDVFEAVSGFDEETPYWEDWDFLFRVSRESPFTGVSEVLAKTHTDANNRLSDAPNMTMDGAEYLSQKHAPIERELERFQTRKFKSRLWQGVGRSALMNGQYADARQFFLKSFSYWPFDYELILYTILAFGGKNLLKLAQIIKRYLVRSKRG